MRQYIFVFFSFLTCSSAFAAEPRVPESSLAEQQVYFHAENELVAVNQLIETTAKQLEAQKQLRDWMIQFEKEKEDFIQGNQTKPHAAKMVRTARQIFEVITEQHLDHLFAKEYLDELHFFSSIAGKAGPKKP